MQTLSLLGIWVAPARLRPPAPLRALVAVTSLLLILLPGSLSAAETRVQVTASGLSPTTVSVAEGSTVVWRNDDTQRHRLTSEGADFRLDLRPGDEQSFTFTTAGTYAYLDDRDDENSAFHGTVTVRAQGSGSAGPGASPATIGMRDSTFRPATIRVSVGATVTWINDDNRRHTTTAPGRWDSGIMETGARFSHTFRAAGAFRYVCALHADMVGQVEVAGQDGSVPSGPPPSEPAASPATPGSPPLSKGTVDVTMGDNLYRPREVTVDAGTTVRWTNSGRALHTVTAVDRSFDSDLLQPGSRWTRTFERGGTYRYLCSIHPEMTGAVVVRGGSPGGGTSAPPPQAGGPGGSSPSAGQGGPSPAGSAPPGSTGVRMLDNSYAPRSVTVAPGGTVVWTNEGRAMHTVTAGDGTFDSGLISSGGRFQRTYPTPGAHPYRCTLHPGMSGVVLVSDASGSTPAFDTSTLDSDSSPGPDDSAAADRLPPVAADAEVLVQDDFFDPERIRVTEGGTVTWRFAGRTPHTVTALDGGFDSGIRDSGDSFAYTFEAAGTYEYVCVLHPGMAGHVEVVPSSGERTDGDSSTAPREDRAPSARGTSEQKVTAGASPASQIPLGILLLVLSGFVVRTIGKGLLAIARAAGGRPGG
jgi:plastocyanin